MQWVLNGYLLAVASLILIGGALGDRFGRRRILIAGSTVFAAASLACAVAPVVELLILSRIAQGMGAAMLVPQSLAIIEATFHEDDRGKAIGAWSALGGIAAAIGPLVGGWLVDRGSWRWVFLLNLPIVAVVVGVSAWRVPETRNPDAKQLDRVGALTAFLGLGAITWALIHGPDWGWGSPAVWGTGTFGVAMLAAFVATERSRPYAMVPLDMFANAQFAAANAVTFVIYATIGAVFFFLVVYLQTGMGYSALSAGASLLPVTALMLTLSSKAGDIAQRIGARLPLTAGGVLIAGGLFLFLSH
jgi:EmrB/QacA subfamily drug resistance transporter